MTELLIILAVVAIALAIALWPEQEAPAIDWQPKPSPTEAKQYPIYPSVEYTKDQAYDGPVSVLKWVGPKPSQQTHTTRLVRGVMSYTLRPQSRPSIRLPAQTVVAMDEEPMTEANPGGWSRSPT